MPFDLLATRLVADSKQILTDSAYIIDFGAQFPTFDGVHIFTDFLSNWGQTIILGHLLFSLKMDLSSDDFRKKYKKIHNKYVQIAMAQLWVSTVEFDRTF